MIKYVQKGKRLVKISSTPNTWLEVDQNLTDEEVKNKVENYKQLTGIN